MAYTDEELNEMAVLAIFNYYSGEYSKEYIQDNFKLAIKVLCNNIKNNSGNSNVKQMTQGSRSITYKDNIDMITTDVLALLPKKNNFYAW